MSAPRVLAETLKEVSEPEYARFVAHWLTRASELDSAPELTGDTVIDALVAAASAHVAMTIGQRIPLWANETARAFDGLWYVGPPGFFANALVHSPLSFTVRGVLIEEDSLVCV